MYLTADISTPTKRTVTKLCGCFFLLKIADNPQPRAQENSESPAIFIFVCLRDVPEKANLSSFFGFWAGKSCSKLKFKQDEFFRLALAVRTKKSGEKTPME